MSDEHFEGHTPRECGEHRTTGLRAWCFTCSDWCYPEQPCVGCEWPMLRAEVRRLVGERGIDLATGDYPRLVALLGEDA